MRSAASGLRAPRFGRGVEGNGGVISGALHTRAGYERHATHALKAAKTRDDRHVFPHWADCFFHLIDSLDLIVAIELLLMLAFLVVACT